MKNLYQRLLLLIAGATHQELARHVRYLKIENEILRSKLPKRVPVTPKEQNRLVKFGAKLGKALSELVAIVHPDTLRRWIRESQKSAKRKPIVRGRPRTQEQIRELILKLARENDWGYKRIVGEMRKLGIRQISRQTVRNILKEAGIEPAPDRTSDKWSNFLERHKNKLWATARIPNWRRIQLPRRQLSFAPCAPRRTVRPAIPHSVASPQSGILLHRSKSIISRRTLTATTRPLQRSCQIGPNSVSLAFPVVRGGVRRC